MSETRNDAVQIVRDGIGKPHTVGTGGKSFGEAMNTNPDPETGEGTPRFVHDRTRCRACLARTALDRIEAVVNAAREVQRLHADDPYLPYRHPVAALRRALASLTQETPAQEERT